VVEFSEEVVNILTRYDWSGNLRELRNVIRRAVLLTPIDTITKDCIPVEIIHHSPDMGLSADNSIRINTVNNADTADANNLKEASHKAEYDVIVNALKESGNNKSKAAKLLNIDRKTLYNKMKALNIMN